MLAFDVGNTTGNGGFDFNPTVDRIRVVGAAGSNFRLNQLDGTTITDGVYTFAICDVNFGRTPAFAVVAYTNSDNDPATGTAPYGIDPTLGQVVRITTPNGGTVNTVGSLGIGTLSFITGFNILNVGTSNTAFFAGMVKGSMMSALFTVILDTGAAVGHLRAQA